MDDELRAIEAQLEKLAPKAMPEDMLARMEQAMERWQEKEKVVPFVPSAPKKSLFGGFNVWASAAAVALIGAVSLVFNGDSGTQQDSLAENTAIQEEAVPSENIKHVVPASNTQFDTAVKKTNDGMIRYDAQGRPMRIVSVEFEDEVTVTDVAGKTYKIKRPRVEYYAIPLAIE